MPNKYLDTLFYVCFFLADFVRDLKNSSRLSLWEYHRLSIRTAGSPRSRNFLNVVFDICRYSKICLEPTSSLLSIHISLFKDDPGFDKAFIGFSPLPARQWLSYPAPWAQNTWRNTHRVYWRSDLALLEILSLIPKIT